MTFRTLWNNAITEVEDDASPKLGGDLDVESSTGTRKIFVPDNNNTDIEIRTGDRTSGPGNPGRVTIEAGDVTSGNYVPGGVVVRAGGCTPSTGNGSGARLDLIGGIGNAPSGVGTGGNVRITGGPGTSFGGDIELRVGVDFTDGDNPGAVWMRALSPSTIAPTFRFYEASSRPR